MAAGETALWVKCSLPVITALRMAVCTHNPSIGSGERGGDGKSRQRGML